MAVSKTNGSACDLEDIPRLNEFPEQARRSPLLVSSVFGSQSINSSVDDSFRFYL